MVLSVVAGEVILAYTDSIPVILVGPGSDHVHAVAPDARRDRQPSFRFSILEMRFPPPRGCYAICVVVLLRSVRRITGSLRFFIRILQFALAHLPPIDSGFYRRQQPAPPAARESGVEGAD